MTHLDRQTNPTEPHPGALSRRKLQPLVLVVDDDIELATLVCELLTREGWRTMIASDAQGARYLVEASHPAVVLLDVMLPGGNGLALCQQWRARWPTLGLILFTARGDPMERALGLEIGADDYISKPFNAQELVARVRALLRRCSTPAAAEQTLELSGLRLDLLRREAWFGPCAIELTGVEFKLLLALARAAGHTLSREALSQAVQPGTYRPQDRTVDVQVGRLRRKLEAVQPGRRWIDTIRSEGYSLVPH